MIVDAGHLALPIALLLAIYVAVSSLLGGWQRLPALILSGRYGLYTLPLLLLVSTAALVYAFVTNDFSVRYVAENSNLAMPHKYTWVALYAGNAGSMLFISSVFSGLAVLAVWMMAREASVYGPLLHRHFGRGSSPSSWGYRCSWRIPWNACLLLRRTARASIPSWSTSGCSSIRQCR